MRAYWVIGGAKVYGNYSAEVSAVPAPATPARLRASKASGGITLRWTTVAGATGYEVCRAGSKNGPYQTVLDVAALQAKDPVTVHKTHYYKVRAYRTVNGSRVYGSWTPAAKLKF